MLKISAASRARRHKSTGGEVANALVCKTSIRRFNPGPVLHLTRAYDDLTRSLSRIVPMRLKFTADVLLVYGVGGATVSVCSAQDEMGLAKVGIDPCRLLQRF